MVKKSNFLKNLLTTASILAVTASAGNAMAQDLQNTVNQNATIANGGGDVTTTKTPTNNNKLPSIGVEMTAGTNINDEPEELSGVEIRNWAAEKEETDTV